MLQASLPAEQRELLEESDAIQAAQARARKYKHKKQELRGEVTKAQGKRAMGSNGRGGRSSVCGPSQGPMARWLARACVQGDAL